MKFIIRIKKKEEGTPATKKDHKYLVEVRKKMVLIVTSSEESVRNMAVSFTHPCYKHSVENILWINIIMDK